MWVDGEYLRGELRSDRPQELCYHIHGRGTASSGRTGWSYRVGQVWQEAVDPRTGVRVERTLLRENHARVMYDTAGLGV